MFVDLDRLRQGWGRQALCRGPSPVPKGPRCYNVSSPPLGMHGRGTVPPQSTIMLPMVLPGILPQIDLNTHSQITNPPRPNYK
jgi:hypothetical protein